MKLFLILSLFTMALPAFALTCKSEENSEKILSLNSVEGNLIEGKIISETLNSILVGTVSSNIIESTYNLFNHLGEPVTFILKKDFPPVSHCRVRVCDFILNQKKTTGKLLLAGKDDEYFTCL